MANVKQPLLNDEKGDTVEYESREAWKHAYIAKCKSKGTKVGKPEKVLDARIMAGKAVFLNQIDQTKFMTRQMLKLEISRQEKLNKVK